MFDGNDDARCDDRRVAVVTGSGRRRWLAADKAAVIRETLVPGARISDVARRWQMDPQQVYRWRHSEGVSARMATQRRHAPAPDFVPIMTDVTPVQRATPSSAAPAIEVKLAGAVVRVASGLDDAAQLTAVLRAVRASASRT
jgi:transposase